MLNANTNRLPISRSVMFVTFILILGVALPIVALSSSVRQIELPARPAIGFAVPTPIAPTVTGEDATHPLRLRKSSRSQSITTPAEKQYNGTPISLNVRDIAVRDFFSLLAGLSGIEMFIEPSVSGTITFTADSEPWDKVLDDVALRYQLDYSMWKNMIVVTTKQKIYLIRTGDTLIVYVYNEPFVSGQVVVRPDGRISVSLLNDIPAAGLSPAELKQIIEGRIKKYLPDPHVTIVVARQ